MRSVACGCDSRKEIMFDLGRIGVVEGGILAVALTAVLLAWRVNS